MSDAAFALPSNEKVAEVLVAVANNTSAVNHLVLRCGCATFRYNDEVFFILAPATAMPDTLNAENGVHVAQILDADILAQITKEVQCGNPYRMDVGTFLTEQTPLPVKFLNAISASVTQSVERALDDMPGLAGLMGRGRAPQGFPPGLGGLIGGGRGLPAGLAEALQKMGADGAVIIEIEVRPRGNSDEQGEPNARRPLFDFGGGNSLMDILRQRMNLASPTSTGGSGSDDSEE